MAETDKALDFENQVQDFLKVGELLQKEFQEDNVGTEKMTFQERFYHDFEVAKDTAKENQETDILAAKTIGKDLAERVKKCMDGKISNAFNSNRIKAEDETIVQTHFEESIKLEEFAVVYQDYTAKIRKHSFRDKYLRDALFDEIKKELNPYGLNVEWKDVFKELFIIVCSVDFR